MGKMLLGKLLLLLHGEMVVGEVAVGEISDWGNCCCFWGSCLGEVVTGEVALGKKPNTGYNRILAGRATIYRDKIGY